MFRDSGQCDEFLLSRKWDDTILATLVRVERHQQRPSKNSRRKITQLAKKRFLEVTIITLTKKKVPTTSKLHFGQTKKRKKP